MLLAIALVITAIMAYLSKKAAKSPSGGSVSSFFTPPPGWTPDTMARVPSADINLIPLYIMPWVLWMAGTRSGALATAVMAVCLRIFLRSVAKGGKALEARKAGKLALPDDVPDGPLRVPQRPSTIALVRRTLLPRVLPFTQEPYFGGVMGGLIAQSATTLAPWLSTWVQTALYEGGLLGCLLSLAVCVAELAARDLERKYGPRSKDTA